MLVAELDRTTYYGCAFEAVPHSRWYLRRRPCFQVLCRKFYPRSPVRAGGAFSRRPQQHRRASKPC